MDGRALDNAPALEAISKSRRIIWGEPFNFVWAMQRECGMLGSNITGKQLPGTMNYDSVHLESGALAKFSISGPMQPSETVTSSLYHQRWCLEGELLGGLAFSFIIGTVVGLSD
jgi:hypothetical protein